MGETDKSGPLYWERFLREERFLVFNDGAESYDLWAVAGVTKNQFAEGQLVGSALTVLLLTSAGPIDIGDRGLDIVIPCWKRALAARDAGGT